MLFGVGFYVVFRILLLVIFIYISCGGSITTVGEESANLSAIVYL